VKTAAMALHCGDTGVASSCGQLLCSARQATAIENMKREIREMKAVSKSNSKHQ